MKSKSSSLPSAPEAKCRVASHLRNEWYEAWPNGGEAYKRLVAHINGCEICQSIGRDQTDQAKKAEVIYVDEIE